MRQANQGFGAPTISFAAGVMLLINNITGPGVFPSPLTWSLGVLSARGLGPSATEHVCRVGLAVPYSMSAVRVADDDRQFLNVTPPAIHCRIAAHELPVKVC